MPWTYEEYSNVARIGDLTREALRLVGEDGENWEKTGEWLSGRVREMLYPDIPEYAARWIAHAWLVGDPK